MLSEVKVLEKTENSVSLEFSIPGTSPYFDGHFPEFSLLPAVAQIELVTRFASQQFGASFDVSQIRRVKFVNFIRPDAPLLLRLVKGENTVSFKLLAPETEIVYSTGTLVITGGNW